MPAWKRPESGRLSGDALADSPEPQRNGHYVPLPECKQRWAEADHRRHHDMSLPHGWHLNKDMELVPPTQIEGQTFQDKKCRHI
jgi:hypothetical protein